MDGAVCPKCGRELRAVETGVTRTSGRPDEVWLDYRCTDPTCDGSIRDTAPGSMGGDNGGG